MTIEPFDIVPLPADAFVCEHDWSVVDINDLCAELGRLRSTVRDLGPCSWCPDDEWEEHMLGFIGALASIRGEPRPVVLRSLLKSWSPCALYRLRMMIVETQRALRDVGAFCPRGASQGTRTVLVPAPYAMRIRNILLWRTLPVAWLMRLRLWDPSQPEPSSSPALRLVPPPR